MRNFWLSIAQCYVDKATLGPSKFFDENYVVYHPYDKNEVTQSMFVRFVDGIELEVKFYGDEAHVRKNAGEKSDFETLGLKNDISIWFASIFFNKRLPAPFFKISKHLDLDRFWPKFKKATEPSS